MLKVALLGAGRIAKVHAKHIDDNPDSVLFSVSSHTTESAKKLAEKYRANVLSVEEAINHPEVDVVLIATPNDTHADFVEQAARTGKAIFCEKPIDLDIARVKACVKTINESGVPFMIGFNRRFDPDHSALQQALAAGEIGSLEHLQINSRDPSPPPKESFPGSGGIFRDMTIHDFDMARFLLQEEPVSVSTIGAALVNPEIAQGGDLDVIVVTLQTASGKIVVINNSRRSGYGFDQRIEAHGQRGSLQVDNLPATSLVKSSEECGTQAQKSPYATRDRYSEAFSAQWAAFIAAVKANKPVPITADDGLKALLLAEAAIESYKTKKVVSVSL
ncbi:inositol 2-dehydrogenase [Rouxiella sp. T17]|uniref:inositol 2-dehydrogenase n=1 Tax=Rouxiella sp. T17 TaxID=3085684 RepID=UPI002FC585EA